MKTPSLNVLFVCLGNICRSPTAHGVLQYKVDELGLRSLIKVDSAGTSAWHIGSSPDERSVLAAKQRGYDLSYLRARQAVVQDFYEFDYILAMDEQNLNDLQAIQPVDGSAQLALLLSFSLPLKDADSKVSSTKRLRTLRSDYSEVPDPYHGKGKGFELVLDLVEHAADGLLQHIARQHTRIAQVLNEHTKAGEDKSK